MLVGVNEGGIPARAGQPFIDRAGIVGMPAYPCSRRGLMAVLSVARRGHATRA